MSILVVLLAMTTTSTNGLCCSDMTEFDGCNTHKEWSVESGRGCHWNAATETCSLCGGRTQELCSIHPDCVWHVEDDRCYKCKGSTEASCPLKTQCYWADGMCKKDKTANCAFGSGSTISPSMLLLVTLGIVSLLMQL
eukprot:TRINITY_DN21704_c0_g1_i1.p1 TRINITY_DN21704_c0_g1~~TRINITY_DN21704_c0_g1_i1.p1  ORF type:complete len:138 (+),score=20.95 TRINITY_DN21704_c0_g1_i1:92-505(+)